jgi:DNA-binding winged helix-turn-helix (wHTH) protein
MKSELDKALEMEFAGFRLDPTGRQLWAADGSPIKLNSRAFDTLLALVVRPGELVSKRSLHNAVWPDVVVGDNNLNQAIAAIRKALGDTGPTRRIIQTNSGRGFCFIAEVSTIEPTPPRAQPDPAHREAPLSVADFF